jgi:hypothetical protein
MRYGVVGFRSKNFIAILLREPVILPDLNLVPITYIPIAAFFKKFDSMMDASPSITWSGTCLSLKYIMVGIILSFQTRAEKGVRVNMEPPPLFS